MTDLNIEIKYDEDYLGETVKMLSLEEYRAFDAYIDILEVNLRALENIKGN